MYQGSSNEGIIAKSILLKQGAYLLPICSPKVI